MTSPRVRFVGMTLQLKGINRLDSALPPQVASNVVGEMRRVKLLAEKEKRGIGSARLCVLETGSKGLS